MKSETKDRHHPEDDDAEVEQQKFDQKE